MSLLALLVIIWVICKAVDYHEECEDDRLLDWANSQLGNYGDTYNIDVDARQVHIDGHDFNKLK